MKIGELAEKSGLTERMLRHYEDLGIIAPDRTHGGTRRYSELDVEVAKLVKHFRSLDVPLETLADVAKERKKHETGHASQDAVANLLKSLADVLAQKAEQSLALHRLVRDASDAVRACDGCPNAPSPEGCQTCPMNAHSHDNAVAAMIWHSD